MKKEYQHLWMVDQNENTNGDKKNFWTKVGVAFKNKDGSWSLELQAIPVSGRLQMRAPKQRESLNAY